MSSAWACSPGGLWPLPLPLLASRCPRLSCGPGPPASPARCVRKQGRTDTLSLSHRYGDGRLAMRSAAPWLPHPRAAATPVLASRPGSAGDRADPQHDCDNAAALLRLLLLPLGKPTPSSLLHLIAALPPRSLARSLSPPPSLSNNTVGQRQDLNAAALSVHGSDLFRTGSLPRFCQRCCGHDFCPDQRRRIKRWCWFWFWFWFGLSVHERSRSVRRLLHKQQVEDGKLTHV